MPLFLPSAEDYWHYFLTASHWFEMRVHSPIDNWFPIMHLSSLFLSLPLWDHQNISSRRPWRNMSNHSSKKIGMNCVDVISFMLLCCRSTVRDGMMEWQCTGMVVVLLSSVILVTSAAPVILTNGELSISLWTFKSKVCPKENESSQNQNYWWVQWAKLLMDKVLVDVRILWIWKLKADQGMKTVNLTTACELYHYIMGRHNNGSQCQRNDKIRNSWIRSPGWSCRWGTL